MPTTKKRLNITLSRDLDRAVSLGARARNIPEATLVAELVRSALELEEDIALGELVRPRQKGGRYISHEKAWRKVTR